MGSMFPKGDIFDVAIIGAGLAGSALALQLHEADPSLRVALIDPERDRGPTIGESIVELGACYLRRLPGVAAHLDAEHLPKLGLRFHLTGDRPRPFAARTEVGSTDGGRLPAGWPRPAHHVDRPRLDAFIAGQVDRTPTARRRARVEQVDLGAPHRLRCVGDGLPFTLDAHWVVDASGLGSVLARQLDLSRDVGHPVHAAWARFEGRVDPDRWDADPRWAAQTPPGMRWQATNHLMGHGYWVWVIPLPDGHTSVGLVADPAVHGHGAVAREDRWLRWLECHEPILADDLRGRARDGFRIRRRFSRGCRRLVSRERWAVVGDAGLRFDPLYSPGIDFIGLQNSGLTRLITADRRQGLPTRALLSTELLLQRMAAQYFAGYRGYGPLAGRPAPMVEKLAWDAGLYFGFTLTLFDADWLLDPTRMHQLRDRFARVEQLQSRAQAWFHRWARAATTTPHAGAIDHLALPDIRGMYVGSRAPRHADGTVDEAALVARIDRNLGWLDTRLDALAGRVAA